MTEPAIEGSHPYWIVRELLISHRAEIEHLNFSYYKYTPQTIADERINLNVRTDDFFDSSYIALLFKQAPADYEVAFHSSLNMISGELKHLPMIDMSTTSGAQLSKIQPILDGQSSSSFYWYRSGRSYHGYGNIIITHENWIELMGRFLLANPIGQPPIVDPRWIGHRLIAGYSALRWTKNTDHYKLIPRKF